MDFSAPITKTHSAWAAGRRKKKDIQWINLQLSTHTADNLYFVECNSVLAALLSNPLSSKPTHPVDIPQSTATFTHTPLIGSTILMTILFQVYERRYFRKKDTVECVELNVKDLMKLHYATTAFVV